MACLWYNLFMDLSDFVIILCRASEPGNAGAVCRAMKNMGLSRLRMVAPEFADAEPVLTRAIHAGDVWHNAEFFDTLADAVTDCPLVVGTTRRRGRKRKSVTLEPRALAQWLAGRQPTLNASAQVALVFGNERTGLEDDELKLCNVASHIPVSENFPSLNLSHAVQVYAYELFLAFGAAKDNPVKGEWVPLDRRAADGLAAEITGALAGLGFYKKPGREEQTRFLRDLVCRAGLTDHESRYLKDIFIKAARLGSMQMRNERG
jgi:tRNA/rRNA methyltransferase/tRNA (cytidine32/uridine32-2'-O)-methyltransferase